MTTLEFHLWLRHFQANAPLAVAFRAFLAGMGGSDGEDEGEEVSGEGIAQEFGWE